MSGLQLLALGVIGQYLARIFDEVQGRPPWIIAYALGFAECAQAMISDGSPAIAPSNGVAAKHRPPVSRQRGNTMQESYSTLYADLWRRHWWWRAYGRELVMRTVEQLFGGKDKPSPQRTIFDIGCAGGVSFDDLSRYGEVYGSEPDPTLVDSCP